MELSGDSPGSSQVVLGKWGENWAPYLQAEIAPPYSKRSWNPITGKSTLSTETLKFRQSSFSKGCFLNSCYTGYFFFLLTTITQSHPVHTTRTTSYFQWSPGRYLCSEAHLSALAWKAPFLSSLAVPDREGASCPWRQWRHPQASHRFPVAASCIGLPSTPDAITVFHPTLSLFPGTVAPSNDYHHPLASTIAFMAHVIDLSKAKNVKSSENISIPLLIGGFWFFLMAKNK